MLKLIYLCCCICLSSCFFGTTTSINVIVERPAEINMIPYKKIIISQEKGEYTPEIAEMLEIKIKNAFEILSPKANNFAASIAINSSYSLDVDSITKESTIATIEEDLKIGQRAGVIKRNQFTRHNQLAMKIIFTIRNASNEIISTKEYNPKNTINETSFNKAPPPLDPKEKLTEFIFYVVKSFVSTIEPSRIVQKIQIEKVEHKEFEKAIKLAQKSNWEEALPIFKLMYLEEVNDQKIRAKNIYNYALALHYSHNIKNKVAQLQKANKLYKEAYSLSPEFLYVKQQEYCEQDIESFIKK